MYSSTYPKALFNSKDENHHVELVKKESETHDVRHFRFRLPDKQHISGIRPGNHIRVTAEIDGKKLSRFYSPVSDPDERGFFDLVLKVYPISEEDSSLGRFSRYMDSNVVGNTLVMSGPFGQLSYQGHGRFKWHNGTVKDFRHIAMIAGGTGITPMVQIIRSVARNPKDGTKVSLLYTNKLEQDIVFRDELEASAKNRPESFSLALTLTRAPPNTTTDWPYALGRIDDEMISSALPRPGEDVLVLVCGRKEMNQVAKQICTKLGFPHIHVY